MTRVKIWSKVTWGAGKNGFKRICTIRRLCFTEEHVSSGQQLCMNYLNCKRCTNEGDISENDIIYGFHNQDDLTLQKSGIYEEGST